MDATENRRRWPRLVLTLPPDANDALATMARDHFRDRKREALRLVLEGIARGDDHREAGAPVVSDPPEAPIRKLAAKLREEVRARPQPVTPDRPLTTNPVTRPDRSPRGSGTAVRPDALDGAR